mmetsp:Transcript_34123/g.67202  ORF Transcript_34123/g.67202 Transcript_34123/m.67202 type:complete len:101 (+) Transcript_34123:218-520(+)
MVWRAGRKCLIFSPPRDGPSWSPRQGRPQAAVSTHFHLVQKAYARYDVLIGLAPHGLALRLHARHDVEDGHGPVKDTQTALHLVGGLWSESPSSVSEVRR